ncbi:MAG: hypothetical protein AAGD38_20435, partial [Acidobacteriota bacterium]
LHRTDDGRIGYSKPVIFALAAAPAFAVLGPNGLFVLNGVLLVLALVAGWGFLHQQTSGDRTMMSTLLTVTFVGASPVLAYLAWRMGDVLQLSLSLIGLVLILSPYRGAHASRLWSRLLAWRGATSAGTVLLALVVVMRPSNLPLLAVPFVVPALYRQWRQIAMHGVVLVATTVIVLGASAWLSGTANPYRAFRFTFTPQTGYPISADDPVLEARIQDGARATVHTGRRAIEHDVATIGWASVFFLVGRHSGLLIYFPAALAFIWAAVRWGDRLSWALVAIFAGAVALYVVLLPGNYFGGSAFVGNRYVLASYPLLLVALRRPPSLAWLVLTWALAFSAWGSAAVSAERSHSVDRTTQNHAWAGIFRLLPHETTGQYLLDGRDRYWSGHYLRFADPFADLGPRHIDLVAGWPATEVLIAHHQPLESVRWHARSDDPRAVLMIDGGDEIVRTPLGGTVAVDVTLGPPLRSHGYWFAPETLYFIHRVRIGLEAAAGTEARLHYLGDPTQLSDVFSYQVVEVDLPLDPIANDSSSVTVRVRNTSPSTWDPTAITAVFARWKLVSEDETSTIQGPIHELSRPVAPGEEIALELAVTWPEAAGAYRFEADLAQRHVDWFATRLGAPMVVEPVTVGER